MSYLRMIVRTLTYDQTTLRNEILLDGANKAPWKSQLVLYLQHSLQPNQVSKEGHFVAGAGNRIFWGPQEGRSLPRSVDIAGEV